MNADEMNFTKYQLKVALVVINLPIPIPMDPHCKFILSLVFYILIIILSVIQFKKIFQIIIT